MKIYLDFSCLFSDFFCENIIDAPHLEHFCGNFGNEYSDLQFGHTILSSDIFPLLSYTIYCVLNTTKTQHIVFDFR